MSRPPPDPNDPLFQPLRLRGLTLPNRLVMAPMETNYAGDDGEVTPRLMAYYVERAAGGVGMVTVEYTCVDRSDGLGCLPQLSLDSDALIDGHARLAAAIRAAGARACLQIHHAGRQTSPKFLGGRRPIAPSAFESPVFRTVPRAMDEADIARLIAAFADTAARACTAGYEAIELHGAHGYLLGQFLSPWTNRRDDAWGGDFERRLAFPLAVIRAVRARIGDRPLIWRLSADEGVDGGLRIEDCERIAPRLAQAGVDAIHVSTGVAERLDMNVDPIDAPDGWRLPLARRIRAVAGVPVIGVGVIRTADTARAAIAQGDCDLVALGRALLADPQWPAKVAAGRADLVRPCTSCNWCIDRLARHLPVGCAENPRLGRETEPPPPPAPAGTRTVVVGAGPGGMAAALWLREAGCDVTLFERRAELGGGLIASATPPGKDKLFRYRDWLAARVGEADIALRLGHAPSADEIAALSPDLVVLATGARTRALGPDDFEPADADASVSPPRVGMGLGETAAVPPIGQAYDVAMGDVAIGTGPVVVLGGGETGCEVAVMAAERGVPVTLVSRSPAKQLARSAESVYRRRLVGRVRGDPAIRVVPSARLLGAAPGGVRLRREDGGVTVEPAAQVFAALGRDAGTPLARALAERGVATVTIGDAQRIARIGEAVEGAWLAVADFLRTRSAAHR